jgi:hypothetical protein
MNYSRFYALLNRLPVRTEEIKENFVSNYTGGRTTSLREMSPREYAAMCDTLARLLKDDKEIVRDEIRSYRSTALHLMQKLGIDTTDWARINAFCCDQRIAGKPFAALTCPELSDLAVKLRGIRRKGGLNARSKEQRPAQVTVIPVAMPTGNHVN